MSKDNSAQYIIGFLFVLICLILLTFTSPNEVLASTLYFPHTNHQGSVIAVTDENGTVVSQNRHFPYGEERAAQGNQDISERKYTSQIKDTETNLYYYNARYYDPLLSTFISPDTVGGNLNRYAYVSGNPVNFVDPSGNRTICDPYRTDNGTCIETGLDKDVFGYEDPEVIFGDFTFFQAQTITERSARRPVAIVATVVLDTLDDALSLLLGKGFYDISEGNPASNINRVAGGAGLALPFVSGRVLKPLVDRIPYVTLSGGVTNYWSKQLDEAAAAVRKAGYDVNLLSDADYYNFGKAYGMEDAGGFIFAGTKNIYINKGNPHLATAYLGHEFIHGLDQPRTASEWISSEIKAYDWYANQPWLSGGVRQSGDNYARAFERAREVGVPDETIFNTYNNGGLFGQ